jgi:hypothetical protein
MLLHLSVSEVSHRAASSILFGDTGCAREIL